MVLCKFHSVFLSQKGHVYTCGHGPGGRLGHGDEQTCLVIEMSFYRSDNFSKTLINWKFQLTQFFPLTIRENNMPNDNRI